MEETKSARFALLNKDKKMQNVGETIFFLFMEDDTCHRNLLMQENFRLFSANKLKPYV